MRLGLLIKIMPAEESLRQKYAEIVPVSKDLHLKVRRNKESKLNRIK